MDDLGPLDEVELGEREDAVAVQGRLEGEVEALDCLGPSFWGGVSRAVDIATPIRRFSRTLSSSARRISIASRVESSPFSIWRTV